MRWIWIAAVAALVLLVAIAAGVHAQPTIPALACPQCFGFQHLEDRIYVDRSMPPSVRTALQSSLADSRRDIEAFYGSPAADPVILACFTPRCQRRLRASAARGVAYGSYGLRLSPNGLNTVIITHELSHIEFHGLIGLRRMFFGDVPSWFDEGLAVVVSNDPRYLLPEPRDGTRCTIPARIDLPVTQKDWARSGRRVDYIYASSACRVLHWMDANGGRAAVLNLAGEMAKGKSFNDVYRDPAY